MQNFRPHPDLLNQNRHGNKTPVFFFHSFCCPSTVVSILTPTRPSHPSHSHFPPLILPLFGFVHVSFTHAPENPPLFLPHYPLPTGYVSLFLISRSLVIFCLLVVNLCTPIFIAAQFTIAKYWKQPKCPSVNEWIKIYGTFTQWNTTQQKERSSYPW